MGQQGTARLDAFTDAAFAFALTLLLIGGGDRVPETYADLVDVVRHIPAFAAGFAAIAMFWHGHVRWRRMTVRASGLSVLLSLTLVFLVLVYVYPLRMMMQSVTEVAMGQGSRFTAREAVNLFTIYGIGFAAMAGVQAMLFGTTLADRDLSDPERSAARHELAAAVILMASGIVSATMAQTAFFSLAPWVYTLIPLAMAVQQYVMRTPAAKLVAPTSQG